MLPHSGFSQSSSPDEQTDYSPIVQKKNGDLEVSKNGMTVSIKNDIANISLEKDIFDSICNPHIIFLDASENDPILRSMPESKIGFQMSGLVKDPNYVGTILFEVTGLDKDGNVVSRSISLYYDRTSAAEYPDPLVKIDVEEKHLSEDTISEQATNGVIHKDTIIDADFWINQKNFNMTDKMKVLFEKGKIIVALEEDLYSRMGENKGVTLILTKRDSLVKIQSAPFLHQTQGFNKKFIPKDFTGQLTILIDGTINGEMVQVPKYIFINPDGTSEQAKEPEDLIRFHNR